MTKLILIILNFYLFIADRVIHTKKNLLLLYKPMKAITSEVVAGINIFTSTHFFSVQKAKKNREIFKTAPLTLSLK